MSKDKYIPLAAFPDVRVRVEMLDGNVYAPKPADGVWWTGEQIAFLADTSPMVRTINDSHAKIVQVLKALAILGVVPMDAPNALAEVVMYHGAFVKVLVWCERGTATKLKITGYAPRVPKESK